MKTSDEQQRAQEIINNADEQTADLLYEMWNELVRHEKEELNYHKILEYWKIRTGAAEERINRALFAARLDTNLTAGEESLKQRILDALKSKINDYSPPPIDQVEMLLSAVDDKEILLPNKMKTLFAAINPDDLVTALIERDWFLNPKLSRDSEFKASVLVSSRGTQVVIPLEKDNPQYADRMMVAMENYAEEVRSS